MKPTTIGILGVTFMMACGVTAPAHAQNPNPPGVNPTHYQCYRVVEQEPFQSRETKLSDQFGTSTVKTVKPVFLCAPVAKNGVRPKDRQTHLVCYEDEGGKAADKKVTVSNQFGKETLNVRDPGLLCVPSRKQVLQ